MEFFDYVLVGGGLQNGLMALAILHHAPEATIALVEKEGVLGGNQTWSFHVQDAPHACRSWLYPLIEHRWQGYEVRFRDFTRHLGHEYTTFSSSRLHDVVCKKMHAVVTNHVFFGEKVTKIEGNRVTCASGLALAGHTVIDARGYRSQGSRGYQKFVGLECELGQILTQRHPVIMDANVEQLDGFRFVYLLPFKTTRCLIEDTVFSTNPDLDVDGYRERVLAYARTNGMQIRQILRQEQGVLPMPDKVTINIGYSPHFIAGMQAGLVHPATGYTFPLAIRLAHLFGSRAPVPPTDQEIRQWEYTIGKQLRFAARLNWMLLSLIPSELRWTIFRRFYKLPAKTIARFYRLSMRRKDMARILFDRPPGASWFTIPGAR